MGYARRGVRVLRRDGLLCVWQVCAVDVHDMEVNRGVRVNYGGGGEGGESEPKEILEYRFPVPGSFESVVLS